MKINEIVIESQVNEGPWDAIKNAAAGFVGKGDQGGVKDSGLTGAMNAWKQTSNVDSITPLYNAWAQQVGGMTPASVAGPKYQQELVKWLAAQLKDPTLVTKAASLPLPTPPTQRAVMSFIYQVSKMVAAPVAPDETADLLTKWTAKVKTIPPAELAGVKYQRNFQRWLKATLKYNQIDFSVLPALSATPTPDELKSFIKFAQDEVKAAKEAAAGGSPSGGNPPGGNPPGGNNYNNNNTPEPVKPGWQGKVTLKALKRSIKEMVQDGDLSEAKLALLITYLQTLT